MKRQVATGIAGLVMAASLPAAEALEGRLVPLSEGVPGVIVWRSKTAMDEGIELIRAKAEYRVVSRYISCIVSPGTRAVSQIQTEGSMFSGYAVLVTVVDGSEAGCRGFVRLKELSIK